MDTKFRAGDTVKNVSTGFVGEIAYIMGTGQKGVRAFLLRDGAKEQTAYEDMCVKVSAVLAKEKGER